MSARTFTQSQELPPLTFSFEAQVAPPGRYFEKSIPSDFVRKYNKVCGEQVGFGDYWLRLMNGHFDAVVECVAKVQGDRRSQFYVGGALIKRNFHCTTAKRTPGDMGKVIQANCGTDEKANTWYIELICAAGELETKYGRYKIGGVGSALIKKIHEFARENGVEKMVLSALPYVITFYHRLGYQLVLDPHCYEPQELTEMLKVIENKRFDTFQDVTNDRDFSDFLLRTLAYGLAMGYNRGNGCAGVDCATDGVYMQVCLKDKETEVIRADSEFLQKIRQEVYHSETEERSSKRPRTR